MKLGRILFGFRDDLDLNQRWWHRLTKVAFVLSLIAVFLWFLNIPADLPQGPGNIRIVETLAEYTKALRLDPDLQDGHAGLPLTREEWYDPLPATLSLRKDAA